MTDVNWQRFVEEVRLWQLTAPEAENVSREYRQMENYGEPTPE
jgi:hypothetical protein